jgi:phage terminase Nu1 subunit (DNA packaging protein)
MDNQGLTTVQLSKRLRADKVLTIRPQAILGWIGRPGYPQPSLLSKRPGQAHLWRYADVLRWIAEGRAGKSPEPHDERTLRARKLAADARKAEIDVQSLEGRLLDRSMVEGTWYEKARQIRDGILMIPDRVSGLLLNLSDQSNIHAILTRELNKALGDLADEIMRKPDASQNTKAPARSKKAGRSPRAANRKRHHRASGTT